MSVVLPIEPDSRYRAATATAGQTAFTVPFPFQDNADVVVIKTPAATSVSATLQEGPDYTLSGAGNPSGGTATLTAAAAAGDRIEVVGQAVLSRLGSIVSAGRYASAVTDSELDRNRIIQQEQARDIGRAWKSPLGAPGGAILVGASGKVPAFDGEGNLVSGPDAVTVEQIGSAAGNAAAAAASADAAWAAAASIDLLSVADRPALAAVEAAHHSKVYLRETGRRGDFIFRADDLSEEVAGDPLQGIYVAPLGDPTGASGAWQRVFSGTASIEWFGAVSGETAENQAELQAAIDFCAKNSITMFIPPGRYRKTNTTAGLTIPDGYSLRIVGAGRRVSVLLFDDEDATTGRNDFFTSSAAVNLDFRDFGIEGTWGAGDSYTGRSQMIVFTITGEANVRGCRFYGSRFMGLVVSGATKARVTECDFEKIKRDGCRLVACQKSIVANNSFYQVIDDSIAIHINDAQGAPIVSDAVVAGNHILDSQGIAILGAKAATVTGNILRRVHTRGILVGASGTGTEGNTANLGITITGNTIEDVFDGFYLAPGAGSGGGRRWIQVQGVPQSTTGGHYVGLGDGSGAVVQPFPYLYTNGINATAPAPGNRFINISGNQCVRTLTTADNYSDYGFGERLMQNGPVDPAITSGMIGGDQIEIDGAAWSLGITGNVLWGGDEGVYLAGVTASAYFSWFDCLIANNVISNMAAGGVRVLGTGTVNIEGNLFDIDPLNVHAARAANGKWSSSYNTVQAIWLDTARANVRGNTFRNVGQVFTGSTPANEWWSGNILMANPVAAGYSADNIGIGSFPRPSTLGATLVQVDDDPASATFRQTLSTPLPAATAMPSSGFYWQDHFVRNATPSVSTGKVLLGWLRLTSGSAHVSGTDWTPCYASTS